MYKSPTLPAPKQHQTITLPPPCFTDGVRQFSSIFSLVLHLTNVLLCDPNTSNLDSSVHNTFLQSSSVQCLCSFVHLNLFLLLAILRYSFSFATLPRRPASRSRLFTVDVETGILWGPFNEGSSTQRCRKYSVSGQSIAFISQNKNRLSSLRRKFSFSGHFESIIKPTIADAPDTQLAQRKARFIASLISTTVFSCANIIAQGFSNFNFNTIS